MLVIGSGNAWAPNWCQTFTLTNIDTVQWGTVVLKIIKPMCVLLVSFLLITLRTYFHNWYLEYQNDCQLHYRAMSLRLLAMCLSQRCVLSRIIARGCLDISLRHALVSQSQHARTKAPLLVPLLVDLRHVNATFGDVELSHSSLSARSHCLHQRWTILGNSQIITLIDLCRM